MSKVNVHFTGELFPEQMDAVEKLFAYDTERYLCRRPSFTDKKHHAQVRQVKAVTELTFIEVQNGNPLIEEDIERFDWEWGDIQL